MDLHVNRSLMLDCLGSEILVALWMKGQVLHREHVHLKVPGVGCRLFSSALPTRKLPMFLSRLKDTSSEREIIWLVSGYVCIFF